MGGIREKYGKLKSPPVIYSIFMLRFSQQHNIESKISDIQASLNAKYPIYEKRTVNNVEVRLANDGVQNVIQQTPENEHHFVDADRISAVLIKNDRIIFHTTSYPEDGFPAFSSWIFDSLVKIVDIINLTHYLSVGLRTIDVIEAPLDLHFADYLNPHFVPLELQDIGLTLNESLQVFSYKTDLGILLLKSYLLRSGGTGIPNELANLANFLSHAKQFSNAVIIDTDHLCSPEGLKAFPFEVAALKAKMLAAHDISSSVFEKTVTKKAFHKWSGL